MKVRAFIIVGASRLLIWHGLAPAQEHPKHPRAEQPKVEVWFGEWEVGGHIYAEGVYRRPDAGDNTLGVGVAEALLGVEAAINDWIGGEVGLLYETVNIGLDDGEDGTSTVVDVATLTIGAPEGSWSFAAGRQYAPFGVFATHLISDPLTLELGEANDLVLQFGLSSGGLHGSIFGFYGDNAQNGGYGAVTGYSLERREIEFGLHLSYISDIGASDNLQGVVAESRDVNENVPGLDSQHRVGLQRRIADWRVPRFAGTLCSPRSGVRRPRCSTVELVARSGLRCQPCGQKGKGCRELSGHGEKRWRWNCPRGGLLAGFSMGLAEWFTPTIEWAHDEDYASKDGGRGEQVSTITVQLCREVLTVCI